MIISRPALRNDSFSKLYIPGLDAVDHSPSARAVTNVNNVTVITPTGLNVPLGITKAYSLTWQ